MAKKNIKKKSHGKPVINTTNYAETMNTLGIDIAEYGGRPRSEHMLYVIDCHYRRILDHQRFQWAYIKRFAGDTYVNRADCDNIVKQLNSDYPNWLFEINSIFTNNTADHDEPVYPNNILIDLIEEEKCILEKLGVKKIQIESQPDKPKTKKLKKQPV